MPNLPSTVSIFSERTGLSSEVNQWNFSERKALHSFYISAAPLPRRFSVPLDSCVIAAPVPTLSPFLTSAPSSNTRPRRLFSFWIVVDIVLLDPSMGSRSHDSCWGVINNICPAFKLSSHCRRKRERDEVGESIPEIHLNLCAKSVKGKGRIKARVTPSKA